MKTKSLPSPLMLLLLFSLSHTFSSAQAPPVKQWDKTYGGSSYDLLYSLQQTSDGGYVLGGTSQSGKSGNKNTDSKGGSDYWVVKTDANGKKQWERTFGGTYTEDLRSLQQTSDGGYILGGSSNSVTPTVYSQYWVVKIDSNGVKQWDRAFGEVRQEDQLKSVQQTTDGGYILGGYTGCLGYCGAKYYVVKIDANGNMQWEKNYKSTGDDALYSLQQTSDGGYILGGIMHAGYVYKNTYPSHPWIIKIDAKGNEQWDKTFEDYYYNSLPSIKQTLDGGYIFGAYFYLSTDYQIIKTDANGNEQWSKNYGGDNHVELRSLQQTSDGGYILGSYSSSGVSRDKTDTSRGGYDYWIVKTDADGNKQWDQTYGGNGDDQLNSLQQTADGGFILGGGSYSGFNGDKTDTSRGGNDYWIVKLSSPKPLLTINNVSITEGNSGQTQLKFRVHLSTASTQTIKVHYTTKDGTAKAPSDYTATSGTLTFMPGVQNKNVTVLVNGDVQCEGDEVFKVMLSNPVNAALKDSIGKGTILNDDGSCMVSTSTLMKADVNGHAAVVVTPNPASNMVNIRISGISGSTAIQLISLQGKVLRTIKTQSGTSEQFNVADIASGTYFLAVMDEQGNKQTVKVVVVH